MNDIIDYISMKSFTYIYLNTCLAYAKLRFIVVYRSLFATIIQRRLCCGSRNLPTTVFWAPGPDDGCALGNDDGFFHIYVTL